MNKPILPHNPGAISQAKIEEAASTVGPVEDIISATIVGAEPRSGTALVRDISGNTYTVEVGFDRFAARLGIDGRSFQAPALVVGQQVVIARSRSTKGERSLRLLAVVPLGRAPQDVLASLGQEGNINELCTPSQTAATQGGIGFGPPAPDDPSEPQVPSPPLEPNPNQPEPEDEPPSKPPGCGAGDNTQWFNGDGCPAGMSSLGFAELPGGAIMTLCQGQSDEPGDGCPTTPDTYGFACTSTGCQYVPNGTYLTLEDCEATCNQAPEEPEIPLKFSCVNFQCVPSTTGTFNTLAECEASGCQTVKWRCNLGTCVTDPAGTFNTRAECQASCQTPAQTRVTLTGVLLDGNGNCGIAFGPDVLTYGGFFPNVTAQLGDRDCPEVNDCPGYKRGVTLLSNEVGFATYSGRVCIGSVTVVNVEYL